MEIYLDGADLLASGRGRTVENVRLEHFPKLLMPAFQRSSKIVYTCPSGDVKILKDHKGPCKIIRKGK